MSLFFSTPLNAAQTEDKLLLAYVYNLAKFVTWPHEKGGDSANLRICFYGELGSLTGKTKALEGKSKKKQKIVTSELSRGSPLADCHIVYVSDSEEIYYRQITQEINKKAILSISRSDNFLASVGIVALVNRYGKLLCDINTKEIHTSTLKVSSQIMRLECKVIQ